jgi:hypothetical protein
MKSSVVAALGAAVLTFGLSSAAQAALIDFSVAVLGETSYSGPTLNASTAFNLDSADLVVAETGVGDESGLKHFATVTVSPSDIMYGAGTGPSMLGTDVVKSWTGLVDGASDTFTETLTNVLSINRGTTNAITVTLSGMVSDTAGVFVDAPIFLIFSANQAGGPGHTISATFTDTTDIGAIPETSTWAMMALGFGALGYAASRRRKASIAMLSA